jgi:hypothetical protein
MGSWSPFKALDTDSWRFITLTRYRQSEACMFSPSPQVGVLSPSAVFALCTCIYMSFHLAPAYIEESRLHKQRINHYTKIQSIPRHDCLDTSINITYSVQHLRNI